VSVVAVDQLSPASEKGWRRAPKPQRLGDQRTRAVPAPKDWTTSGLVEISLEIADTQCGSKTVLTMRKRCFWFTPINAHHHVG